jgi:hypothetical protein
VRLVAPKASFTFLCQSRPSKSERFFCLVSLIFTLNHRRHKMSQFDTSVKKNIESINISLIKYFLNVFLS